MGYAYTVELPSAGTGDPVPVNVVGQTYFGGETVAQFAYDVANFNSNQFVTVSISGNSILFHFAEPTVLWVRQDPALVGAPASNLGVWTDIGSVNV